MTSATPARRNALKVAFAECPLAGIRRWFPGEALPLALKAWRAAFPNEIPLLPTDGISPDSIAACVTAGGGGWTLRGWPKLRSQESAGRRLYRRVTRDIEQFTRNELTRGRDSECT
jgi:2-keto-3-deoxy-6-phosphogluconate aldolase